MSYWTCDGQDWHHFDSLPQAEAAARRSIDEWADASGHEWWDCVESVCVVSAPSSSEFPDEDGALVLVAAQVNKRPDPSGKTDYLCDYAMRPPRGNT